MPEPIHSEFTDILMVNEANRRTLKQSPGHVDRRDRRGGGRDVSRHQIGAAPL